MKFGQRWNWDEVRKKYKIKWSLSVEKYDREWQKSSAFLLCQIQSWIWTNEQYRAHISIMPNCGHDSKIHMQ